MIPPPPTGGGPHGGESGGMSDAELVELLILHNRGIIDVPELKKFDPELVATIFQNVLRAGYLRTLGSIPAMASHPGRHSEYVFSPAGRIRFHQLERQRAGQPSASQPRGRSGG